MSFRNGGIQLPDDVIYKGYKQTASYTYEQVFYSKKHNFTGTEKEFVSAGLAYQYCDFGNHKRLIKLV